MKTGNDAVTRRGDCRHAHEVRKTVAERFYASVVVALMLLCTVLLCASGLIAQVKAGPAYKNAQWGFSIASPAEWTSVPVKDSDQWTAAKFVSHRRLQQKKGFYQHAPEMRIIIFPKSETEGKRVEKEKATGADGAVTIRIKNPYKGFKDYLEKTASGFYFDEERNRKVKRVPVTSYRTKSSGLGEEVPHVIAAYVYHLEDVDVAVYFDILEDHFKKYYPSFSRIFSSFRVIDRKEVASTGGVKSREEYLQSLIDALPRDWFHIKTKRYLILSHSSRKFTATIAEYAESFRTILEREFPPPEGNQPVTPIIRICKDDIEYSSYQRGAGLGSITITFGESGVANIRPPEIALSADKNWGGRQEAFRDLAFNLFRAYGREIFEGLDMPYWLSMGLADYFTNVRGKGRSAKASPPAWQVQAIKRVLREEESIDARRLIETRDGRDLPSKARTKMWGLVTYLKDGAPRRSEFGKLIDDYIANLILAKQELDAKRKNIIETNERQAKSNGKKNFTPDFSGLSGQMQKLAYDRTFGSWEDKDWQHFERACLHYWK